MAIFALVGLALVSLAALAWQVGRPIDVPASEETAGASSPKPPPLRASNEDFRAPPGLEAKAPQVPAEPDAEPDAAQVPPRKGGIRRGEFPGMRGREGLMGATRPGGFRRLDNGTTDPVMSMQMDEANQFYQRGQYAEAKEKAQLILSVEPENSRMLRLVVSSACMLGDAGDALTHYNKLTTTRDRAQMRARCSGAGVELPAD